VAALAAAALAIGAACGGGGGSSSGAAVFEEGPPFSVSGAMVAVSGSAIDSDTNDLLAPFASNDSGAQAQEIPNPVSLGGHVNLPGAKPIDSPDGGPPPDGRTTVSGDLADWYRVSIAMGQVVRLLIAENGTTNDLDLELRSAVDESLITSSATSSRTEEISVSATDDYYVVVVASAGFSNYTLTIGNVPSGSAGPALEPEFVPGEVIVVYEDDVAGALAAKSAPERAAGLGMRHVAGSVRGPMLFSATTREERATAFRALGLASEPSHALHGSGPAKDAGETTREDTRRLARALRRQPGIRSADLNYLRQPTATPTDEFYPFQWHYDQINLPQAWDVTTDGSPEVVAVLDTGVKTGHPDLSGQLVTGYDFISNTAMANDGDACDGDPDDPGDGAAPGTSSYHGTHVIGTVAARTSLGGGNSVGVAGVAWNVSVMPLRVLGVGGGTDFDIMAGLRYAANRANACGVTPGSVARIVNMSLGGPGFNLAFQNLITDLRNVEGMIFIAAAGNENSSSLFYPAAYDGVVSVSAVGSSKTKAPYSNFGATIDVAAPGGDFTRDIDGDGFPDGVLSTLFDDNDGSFIYAFYEGTSMATPHMAGVVALMRSINPAITPFDIDNALNAGDITEDLGNSQLYGNGLIDAVKAVNLAADGDLGSTVLVPFLRVDPDGLNYGFLADDFLVSVNNGGNDAAAFSVSSVTFTSDDGDPWLTISPESVDADGLGSYLASVDRTGLADGLYTGTIEFVSTENTVNVPVIMQVGDPSNAEANAGHHFVLLVDSVTLDTVGVAESDASGGRYRFSFGDVDPGSYILIAGSDSDGDFFICDPGEACGAFPTTETIVPLEIQSNRSGIEFVTGFNGSIGAASAGSESSYRGFARRVGEGARR
jgi:serine protease